MLSFRLLHQSQSVHTKRAMHEYIVNDSARKACLKKRWPSLIKKVREITILCGVRVCVVIYIPNEPEPVFWPSRAEVVRIMQHFIRVPEMEKSRKKMNQESYLKDKIKKLEEQVKQLWERNREMEAQHFMRQMRMGGKTLNEFSLIELRKLEDFAYEKLTMIQKKRNRRVVAATAPTTAPSSRQVVEIRNSDPWSIVKPRKGEGLPWNPQVNMDFGTCFCDGGSSSCGDGVGHATMQPQTQVEGSSDMSATQLTLAPDGVGS